MTPQSLTAKVLRKLLDTGDEADRCYAIRALGKLRDQGAIEQLIKLLYDEDTDVCMDAAEALGEIRASKAVPALITLLENDPNGEICAISAEALGKIGRLDALEALTKIAIERPEQMQWNNDWDTWWDVQLEAVKALGLLGSETAVDPLLQILDDEGQQDIENAILSSLARIPGKGIGTLIERLQAPGTPLLARRRICIALSQSQNKAGIKALGRALQDSEAQVRAAAATGLAATGAQRYLKALLILLHDPEDDVRTSALKAIIELSKDHHLTQDTVSQLLPSLEDSSGEVRGTLLSLLAKNLHPGDLSKAEMRSVLSSLTDASAETAAAACTLLGQNRDTEALPSLLEYLQYRGGHPMVRRQAALAVGQIGELNQEILDILSACVGDQQQPVRLGALSALMMLDKQANPDNEELQRPLEIIISAVKGDITIAPARKQIIEKLQQEAIPDQANPQEPDASNTELTEAIGENQAASEDTTQNADTHPTTPLDLPKTAGQIVEAGEVKPALSTLDAIALDNIEVALNLNSDEAQAPDLDEVTEEYLAVVEKNKETMRRIRSEKNIQPEQDVRRLGARILSECEEPEAIASLIQALNDDDSLLRREAADAIGQIGARNPKIPELMDAVGILITQLAIGDMLQKVTCARALGLLGNKMALLPLSYALKESETNVRVQAIDALARLVIQGADPKEANHMVIIELSPLSISKKLMGCLNDPEMAVRVAATRALASIVPTLNETRFVERVIDATITSALDWSGEEARPLGRCLRSFDRDQCTRKLLSALDAAKNSIERSIYIEMLEELLNPELGQPEQAA